MLTVGTDESQAQATLTVNDDAQGSGPAGATCRAPNHTTIQAAVTAAVAGDTILVCAGAYTENVTINKANLTPSGAQAENDARTGRTDPTAESVVSGGANIAFNTNGTSGVTIDGFWFANTSNTPVSMRNGSGHTVVNSVFNGNTGQHAIIYSTDGTTPSLFRHNRINNKFHGIFGSTAMHNVTITENEFSGHTYSAIHFSSPTNAPGAGSNVTVSNNQSNGPVGSTFLAGTGISGLTVTGNTSTGVGIDLLGSFDGVQITNNTIADSNFAVQVRKVYGVTNTNIEIRGNTFTDSKGSTVNVAGGTGGVQITGNRISGSPFNAVRVMNSNGLSGTPIGPNTNISVLSNILTGNAYGVRVLAGGLEGLMNVNFNRIVGNTTAGLLNESTVEMNAENNWWGCNAGPNTAGCDTVSGSADFDPWLVLGISASPDSVSTEGDSTITADLTRNSADTDTSGSGTLPNGTPTAFTTDLGSVSPASAETADGKATTTFAAGSTAGTATVEATVDQQSVSAPVTVEEQEPPDDRIQCTSKPCYGTNQADIILERVGNGLNDEIRARAGGDTVRANNYKNDRDLVYGGDGGDTLRVDDGDSKDEVRGQGGSDTCIVDARREAVSGCERIIVR